MLWVLENICVELEKMSVGVYRIKTVCKDKVPDRSKQIVFCYYIPSRDGQEEAAE